MKSSKGFLKSHISTVRLFANVLQNTRDYDQIALVIEGDIVKNM